MFFRLISACSLLLLLVGPSCSRNKSAPALLDAGKLGSVVVGRSSRSDVFAALGRPSRLERSASGESWIYEVKQRDGGGQSVLQGAAAASGVIGAFVPYAGIVGSGLGLAGAAMGRNPEVETTSLTVKFGADGLVHDCVYSSTAFPTDSSDLIPPVPIDCKRP